MKYVLIIVRPLTFINPHTVTFKSFYMKATKIMLGFLSTLFITWMTLSLIVFLLSDDMTFKESATDNGVGALMLILGWLPSIIVCIDLEEKLR